MVVSLCVILDFQNWWLLYVDDCALNWAIGELIMMMICDMCLRLLSHGHLYTMLIIRICQHRGTTMT